MCACECLSDAKDGFCIVIFEQRRRLKMVKHHQSVSMCLRTYPTVCTILKMKQDEHPQSALLHWLHSYKTQNLL